MSAIRKTVVERLRHAARLERDPLTARCSRQRRRNHLRQCRCDIWSTNATSQASASGQVHRQGPHRQQRQRSTSDRARADPISPGGSS
jgi:hypothetical protein